MILNRQRAKYWLGIGAEPTHRVHKILELFDMVPYKPVPGGTKHTYYKPPKEYRIKKFKTFGKDPKVVEKELIAELHGLMNIVERKKRIQQDALLAMGEDGGLLPSLQEVETDEIESEDPDIFERSKKFEELQKRLSIHRKEKAHLRGNDLRYNVYLKKMQKLTRQEHGLDIEGYKDYVHNLKQFAHLNRDFEFFSQDVLKLSDPDYEHFAAMLDDEGNVQTLTKEQMKEKYQTKKRVPELQATL